MFISLAKLLSDYDVHVTGRTTQQDYQQSHDTRHGIPANIPREEDSIYIPGTAVGQ